MDTYFKRYFWTFHMGVLFLSAFLAARTVNAFVGRTLETPAEELTSRDVSGGAASRGNDDAQRVSTRAFLDRNLFSAKREDLAKERAEAAAAAAAEEQKEQGEFDPNDCENKSALGANLLATFVSFDRPKESRAVFKGTGPNDEGQFVGVGSQVLEQAEVVAIDIGKVYVRNGGQCEYFSVSDEQKPTARSVVRPPPVVAKKAPADGDMGEGIEKTGDGEFSIPSQTIDNVLSNLNKLATQARIVPSFHNGKANGFKLFSIRPNSLYSKIGIQNGDIVQRINGFEINSPDKALEIYSKLKDARNITVDLVRRGKQQTMSYAIR